MSRVKWDAEVPPHPESRSVPVERFNSKFRREVWMLGDVVVWRTHFKLGAKSKPCQWPDACPLCDPLRADEWKQQREGYFPCLLLLPSKGSTKEKPRNSWQPAVGVLTAGAISSFGVGPHVGRKLFVWREARGSAMILKFEDSHEGFVEPPVGTQFDPRPFIEQLWYPFDPPPSVANIPDPIPVEPKAKLEAVPQSDEARQRNGEMLRRMLRESGLVSESPQTPNAEKRDLPGDLPATPAETPSAPEYRTGATPSPVSGRSPAPQSPPPDYSALDGVKLTALLAMAEELPALGLDAPAIRAELYARTEKIRTAKPAEAPAANDVDAILEGIGCSMAEIATMGTGAIISRGVRDGLRDGHPAKRPSANGHLNGRSKGGAQ